MNPDFPHMSPCPFCGGNPMVMSNRVGTSDLVDSWIECYQCGARSPNMRSGRGRDDAQCSADAAVAWNRRP